jgi:pimeloyl-ACP methyl ester carboxylesterase
VADDATIVLVHGAWHGAWCWEKVQRLLDRADVDAVAVELQLTSLDDDAATTEAAIRAIDGPVIACGHSYGGAVITRAGDQPNVERLVYLTAFACDADESPARTAPDAGVPSGDLSGVLVISEDRSSVDLDAARAPGAFYNDCAADDVAFALERLRPMQLACLTTPVGPPAWRAKPATYVVCTEDRAVHPELQRIMAKRCTESVDFPTGHSPFLNRPDLVADLLVDLARS